MSLATDVQHLVVRLPNWLGDTVMALPVLRALRSGLDGRRITLVGPWAPLLIGQGVAEGGGAYAPGARKRPPVPRRHQVDEYLGLLGPLGIDGAEATPRWLPEGDAQNERLEALLPSGGVNSRPRIGIHLGAAFGPSKLWPAELIAGLCRELRQRRLVPVLLGTPSEEAIANGIVAATGGDVVSLVGRDAPELLPGLLARLDALVSMDTGVAHLAAAVGVPVVALFGPTDPGLTAPRGAGIAVIWKPPPCSPCFLSECPIEHPCMRAIGVEEVLEAVEARLGARSA